MHISNFPEHFTFGTATSSYQIEGNYQFTGTGPSIWTTFCRRPGAIVNGDNGEIACDHYNRWREDIILMKEIGIDSYRFSVSWPRVMPLGPGLINSEGLDFYNKLVDGLLEAGISPLLTLYHWDLPQALQDKGGWAWPGIVDSFAEYTRVMVNTLGDRVTHWITLNEPWVFLHLGHIDGVHAPGMQDLEFASFAYKHILLAHSKALHTIKSINSDLQVGHGCDFTGYKPYSESYEDKKAADRYFDYRNMIFTDPWEKGQLTPVGRELFSIDPDTWHKEDIDLLQAPADFMGFNYYTKYLVAHDEQEFLRARVFNDPDAQVTDMDRAIHPEVLPELLQWAYNRYGLPIYITENGCDFDYPVENGRVKDHKRINFIRDHLEVCQNALQNGIDLRGYYVWSFLDNFEWNLGYSKRFGIVHVDYETQKRIIKDSGYFYRDAIKEHNKAIREVAD